MQELNRQMMTLPELRELEEIIRFGTGPAAVSGVSGVHRAMLGAALRQETKRPLAVLCADEQEARRMAADLTALTGEECVTLFAREWQLRDRVSASHSFEQERLDALCRMAFGRTGIVVATVDGMMQRTLPPTALRDAVLTLRLGEKHDLRALAERLTAAGYVRCEQVEGAGQFAVRGGILDVYSPMSAPVRVEFFDTEIDAMGEFDVATQRRTKNLEELTVLPAAAGNQNIITLFLIILHQFFSALLRSIADSDTASFVTVRSSLRSKSTIVKLLQGTVKAGTVRFNGASKRRCHKTDGSMFFQKFRVSHFTSP